LTVVIVDAGACGFRSWITAAKESRREVRIEIESPCETVSQLGRELAKLGPFGLKDVLAKGNNGNKIFSAGAAILAHASCPVLSAVIKACEVEMGLNIPCSVKIEFPEEPRERG
jgi:hypothetical protein